MWSNANGTSSHAAIKPYGYPHYCHPHPICAKSLQLVVYAVDFIFTVTRVGAEEHLIYFKLERTLVLLNPVPGGDHLHFAKDSLRVVSGAVR